MAKDILFIVREGEEVKSKTVTLSLLILKEILNRLSLVFLMGMGVLRQLKVAMAEVSKRCGDAIEEAIKEAYLTTDMDFLKEDVGGSTCCVTAMIHEGDLVVSNPGDCRAVLSRNGVAEALTSDHHVSRQDERARIEALGGYVDFCHGVWRIQDSLAVSRAIGNKHLKQWVIAEPETKSLKIQPECEFLILASGY
ncbi:hypothetical protein ERO13_D04G069000v2 [Gossypium hirsutum]|uniref:PPM-type phosphatase domain-containing protein n=1 Tax=Gossypium barbadense TaxID=3634 RepID=A0A5J5RSY8_GOSBA|nr:hypothetical protein ES319_D04G077200v1 [Gossypium barbadense]KAG4151504.1 hypothetical protein ERO13_D04G069000v2 [Gossypium hirsutum]